MSKLRTPTGTFSSRSLRKPRNAQIALLATTANPPGFQCSSQHRTSTRSADQSPLSERSALSYEAVETCFIQALVRAGNCTRHAPSARPQLNLPKHPVGLFDSPSWTGKTAQQRFYSTHTFKGWVGDDAQRSADDDGQHIETSRSMTKSVSQIPTNDANKVATWEEYYGMMDKCFLRPPRKGEADLRESEDVPGYPVAQDSLRPNGTMKQRGSDQKAASGSKHYAMLDHSFSSSSPRKAPTRTSRAESRASATGMKQKSSFGKSIERPGEAVHHYRSAVKRQATRLARPRELRSVNADGFYTPTYHDPVWRSVEDFVRLARQDYNDVRRGQIFEAYQKIPQPRLKYIPEKSRRRLLSHLSLQRIVSDSQRMEYMAVMDDHKDARIPLGVQEWSTAISLTARAASKTSSANVNAALQLWREMENDAGIPANTTTFNILLDMAAKAGKFVLADTIWREMEHRQIPLDLFSYTTKIFLEGVRGSAAGVRATYDALVRADEVVDTSVISAVITAYLKCNDPGAAESVFNRAKRMHAEEYGGPRPLQPNDWLERRKQGRMFKSLKRQDADQTVLSPVAPGQHVYRELVYYHAVTAGNIDRALTLVDEMVSLYRIPLEAKIFLNLFKAFAKHGGSPYSSWTPQYLESVFELLLKQMEGFSQRQQTTKGASSDQAASRISSDERLHSKLPSASYPLFVGEALVELCVSAFLKCHSLERAEQVSFILTSRMPSVSPELSQRLEQRFDARETEEDRRIDWQNDRRIARHEQDLD